MKYLLILFLLLNINLVAQEIVDEDGNSVEIIEIADTNSSDNNTSDDSNTTISSDEVIEDDQVVVEDTSGLSSDKVREIAEKEDKKAEQSKKDAHIYDTLDNLIKGKLDIPKKEIKWEDSGVLDGSPDEEQARRLIAKVDKSKWIGIQKKDLDVLQGPYFAIGVVVAIFLVIFIFSKLPKSHAEDDKSLHLKPTLKRLFSNSNYVFGVVAQTFYVGAQIMCWTFIIQYAGNELGMRPADAQFHNIIAMIIFVSSRFIFTFLLKYISPGSLLAMLATGGGLLILGAIFIPGMPGLYSLMGVSACMSLMFPTIYGIALDGLGDDAKLGAAGLILAIGGGCAMPLLQGKVIDLDAFQIGSYELTSTRASFFLPFICFVVIVLYGIHAHRKHIAETA